MTVGSRLAFSVVQRGVYVYFFIRRSIEHHFSRDFFLNLETSESSIGIYIPARVFHIEGSIGTESKRSY